PRTSASWRRSTRRRSGPTTSSDEGPVLEPSGRVPFRLASLAGASDDRLLTPQVQRGVDQGDVAVRLGEVAHLTVVPRVVLLGEQAHVVAQAQQPFVQLPRLFGPPDQVEVVGQPEAA